MNKTILVAGATGNLGYRICRELMAKGAQVRAIVRAGSAGDKLDQLRETGAEVVVVDWSDDAALIRVVEGIFCVVSALAGLREVIVDAQTKLLNAAVSGGVPRFIPSDFSTDFTNIPFGENRNFDLRKRFQERLDSSGIRVTSIFNGTFADILRYNTPLFNVRDRTIVCYDGKAGWKIDFTTVDNTAAYTAAAALDEDTPRALRICSFSVSPNDLVELSRRHKGGAFRLVHAGSLDALSATNRMLRAAHPDGEGELYPKWQQSQYLHSMFLAHHNHVDNDRYPGIGWAPVENNI